MNQNTAIILWRDNIGYVLEKHHDIVVESPTRICLNKKNLLECTAIEYLNKPHFQWERQHFLEVLIPWPTKVGYYKEKFLVLVPVEAIDVLHASICDELSYTQVLSLFKDLKNNTLENFSRSSFELKFHDLTMHVPLNTFIKILGPSETNKLKKISLFGLPFFQWTDHWAPLIEDTTHETKYICIAQHDNGVWAFPLTAAPKLVQIPAQHNDVLQHIVNLLQA